MWVKNLRVVVFLSMVWTTTSQTSDPLIVTPDGATASDSRPTPRPHPLVAMAAIHSVNSAAETARHSKALAINISGARGLQEVLKSNLGPKGTLKM